MTEIFYEIEKISNNKEKFPKLMLLADPDEKSIERYFMRAEILVLRISGKTAGVAAFTDEGGGICEIRNLAVHPDFQKKGWGKKLLLSAEKIFSERFSVFTVGTGDSPLTVPFYKKCGFKVTHRQKNYFTDNYSFPVYEEGRLLKDMIYLEKRLRRAGEMRGDNENV